MNAVSKTFMNDMTTNANVGMNEVVSVFVSKYEDKLYAQKDALQGKIRTLKAAIEALTKKVTAAVSTDQYVTNNTIIGIKSKVDSVNVVWKKEQHGDTKIGVVVNVGVYDTSNSRDYASINKKFVVALDQADINEHAELNAELEAVNSELLEVLANIKGVGRKERQVRGRISELKLEQAGYSDILQNEEMLKLIA